MEKKSVFLITFLIATAIFISTASAAIPTISSISASPSPIKGGATITITPTGQADANTEHALQFYCNETANPTVSDTKCTQSGTIYSNPYNTISCTYAVAADNATHTVYCRLFDGNEYSSDQTASFTTDSTAPTTTISGCGAGVNGWNSADQTIVFSSADPDFNATVYKVGNGEWQTGTSIALSTDGNHVIEYYSTDLAGNIEATKTEHCAIDKTAPATSDNISGNWQSTATLNCSDGNGSGCSKVYYTTDGNAPTISSSFVDAASNWKFSPATEGTFTVKYFGVDNSGKEEVAKTASQQMKVEKTAPVTTDDSVSPVWSGSNKTITLTASDTNSGFAKARYCIYIVGSAQCDANAGTESTSVSTSVSVTCDSGSTCKKKIRYYSTDNAGNSETQRESNEIWIDRQVPSFSATPTATTSGRNITVLWSANDNSGSGIQYFYVFRNDALIITLSGSTTTSHLDTGMADSTYRYRIMARDILGNDANSPEVSATVNQNSVSSGSSSGGSSGGSSNRSSWINLTITSADYAKAGKLKITVSGDEPFEGGYQLKIKMPGSTSFKDLNTASRYSGKSVSAEYEIKSGEDGNASIVAVAWSNSGSRTEKEKIIIIDTKVPSIELLMPKDKEIVKGTVDLKTNASDGNVAVKDVSFYYRKGTSGEWQPIAASATKSGNTWSGKWDTNGLADGQYQLKAVANDAAGNKAEKIIGLAVSNGTAGAAGEKTTVEKQADFSFRGKDINAMFASALTNTALAEEACRIAAECSVSRTIKIIKVTDDKNNESYRASILLSFTNDSNNSVSMRLVEVVPKDFANDASAIESADNFIVIQTDPIIAWDFNGIPAGETVEITYSLKGSLTKEKAMAFAESAAMQKFAVPPILLSGASQVSKNDFNASSMGTTTGFFGFLDNNLMAIILGIVVAGIIASALFFARSGFSLGTGAGYSGAKPEDWTYREAPHEKIAEKIGSSLSGLIGFEKESGSGKKWIFKKETDLAGKKSELKQLIGGIDFTLAKKIDKTKADGRGKWGSAKYRNDDI